MYNVTIKDKNFSKMEFEFKTMEEVAVFTETVLARSSVETEVTIKEVKENA